jgi:flagellar M-ring protein FliF
VNRTIRRTVRPAGRIRRVTAAVVVDDVVEYKVENGQQKQNTRKRSAEEMKQIEELARAAIGFESARGDVISVQNASFVTPPVMEPPPPGKLQRVQRTANEWAGFLRYAVIAAVFAVVYLLVLRPVKKHFITVLRQMPARAALANAENATTLDGNIPGMITESADTKRAQALKRQVLDRVVSQPAAATRLVQGWIGEGGQ